MQIQKYQVSPDSYLSIPPTACPFRLLAAAMIETAIKDHIKGKDPYALDWFDVDRPGGISFGDCCEILDLDAECIREGVRKFCSLNVVRSTREVFAYRHRPVQRYENAAPLQKRA